MTGRQRSGIEPILVFGQVGYTLFAVLCHCRFRSRSRGIPLDRRQSLPGVWRVASDRHVLDGQKNLSWSNKAIQWKAGELS